MATNDKEATIRDARRCLKSLKHHYQTLKDALYEVEGGNDAYLIPLEDEVRHMLEALCLNESE